MSLNLLINRHFPSLLLVPIPNTDEHRELNDSRFVFSNTDGLNGAFQRMENLPRMIRIESTAILVCCLYSLLIVVSLIASGGIAEADETKNEATQSLIDFRDREDLIRRRPILIAHRGGVVNDDVAEGSLTAIRLAANHHYDMVELDIRESLDGVPILFHDSAMQQACGVDGRVADRNASELEKISYLKGKDRIATLETALGLCQRLGLGVMIDLKAGRNDPEFLTRLQKLLEKYQLLDATICITSSDVTREQLKSIRFTPTSDEMRRLRGGERLDLRERFWFGLPWNLQPGDLESLRASGSLIFPAINTFRYPRDRHYELAKQDMLKLLPDVDGFQIDSVYDPILKDDASSE